VAEAQDKGGGGGGSCGGGGAAKNQRTPMEQYPKCHKRS